ncbi:MAG: phosphopentomutase [Clostridia bacterium]|nr:phosphopentomutase [Clostridia bacterium]MDY3785171.1 phosphopentomutase [Eubacteriales bacterium]
MKRVFLIVLDSVGAGEMPDAADYGDAGSNTIRSISRSDKFSAVNMKKLGYGNIDGLDFLGTTENQLGAVARLAERSRGKDTTIGHWEISGIISESPLPTYPHGFPQEVLDEFSKQTGRDVLCNLPYSGTEVIRDYGREHMETGKLIVYTSADSVFQIAAHEDVVDVQTLYEYCRIARKILVGKNAVGRVIARPFKGSYPDFVRTANRHDFSLEPPKTTILDELKANGLDVIAVGKINDIFAGRGITEFIYTHSNAEGMKVTDGIAEKAFNGLCFVNLVDFDMLYGHRNNVEGYAAAFAEFDSWLGGFLLKLGDDDLLMITADHGCDPATESTDHSREYTPLVMYSKNIKPVNLGTRSSFSDIAATLAEIFGIKTVTPGESFAKNIL